MIIRIFIALLSFFILHSCTPKGPQTFESNLIGKSKEVLLKEKGPASRIKLFDSSEAYIFIKTEHYFGKNPKTPLPETPKRIYQTEFIYYINDQGIVYKYQIWKKRVK